MNQIKLLLIVLIMSISSLSYSQLYSATGGCGVSVFGIDTKKASNVGVNMSMSLNKIYCDFSFNGASGKGEQLDFSSSYTKPADKVNVGVFNVGYIISIKKIKKLSLIPVIGWGYSNDIFEDPIGWDTYYYGPVTSHFNIGAVGNVQLGKWVGLYVGCGTYEKFKAGISVQFIQ